MIRLKDIIAPPFYTVHNDIKVGKHTHYFKRGKGQYKSSFVSIEIILGMMGDADANAMASYKESRGQLKGQRIRTAGMGNKQAGRRRVIKGAQKPS